MYLTYLDGFVYYLNYRISSSYVLVASNFSAAGTRVVATNLNIFNSDFYPSNHALYYTGNSPDFGKQFCHLLLT